MVLTTVVVFLCSLALTAQSLQSAVRDGFAGQRGAAIVVRVRDKHVLATYNDSWLRGRVATPGSAIKPFVLQLMLEQGVIKPDEVIACRRALTIAGRSLKCSHPEDLQSFRAQQALAWSCNSYFTTAAARLKAGALERRYAELGFTRPSGLMANDGAGRVHPAATLAGQQLLAIGAAGVQVTPLELAAAYLRLAAIDPQSAAAADKIVLAGLRDSAAYGMGAGASVPNMDVAGKTGTASDPANAQTHAWFAGFAPVEKPQIVVVVFVERGTGAVEASGVAHKIFAAYAGGRK